MLRSASRSGAVALTSAALMGLSALAIPAVAAADDTACAAEDVTHSVTGGAIKWGVKESFRSYLAGPIAHGGWDLDGTTFEGSERGADGQFVWPIADSASTVGEDGSASVSGTGSVRMHGHENVLDTTLSNPTVAINGTAGEIKVDYRAKKPEGFTPTAPFEWVEGTQSTGATFSLEAAQDFTRAGEITVTTTNARLSAELNDAMGEFYGEGAEVDNVTLVLNVTESCTTEPGDGDNGGGDDNGGDNGGGDGDDNGGDNGGGGGDDNTGGGIFGSLSNIFGSLGF